MRRETEGRPEAVVALAILVILLLLGGIAGSVWWFSRRSQLVAHEAMMAAREAEMAAVEARMRVRLLQMGQLDQVQEVAPDDAPRPAPPTSAPAQSAPSGPARPAGGR